MEKEKIFDMTATDDQSEDAVLLSTSEELVAERSQDGPESHSENQHSSHHHGHHHHSGHHHSRHHHRNHRHSRRSKKENKVISLFKNNRSIIVNAVLCVFVVVLLVFLAIQQDKLKNKTTEYMDGSSQTMSSKSVQVKVSIFNDDVCLVSDAVGKYIDGNGSVSAHDIWRDNRGNRKRLDFDTPVNLSYSITGLPSSVSVIDTVVEVSKDFSFHDAEIYNVKEKSGSVELKYLECGVHYYFRVVGTLSNGSTVGAFGDFTTAETPRILSIDGIVNVRDIGGWKTSDGKVIKQGVLYRGSEIDGAVEAEYLLSAQGKTDMLSALGINFEMDLRNEADTPKGKDVLGSGVPHVYYGAPMYAAVFDSNNSEIIRKIFSDLADERNYPMYLHCTYGKDRTGSICYLLEALLGLSDTQLKMEYELSAFCGGFVDPENWGAFINEVRRLEGDTTTEKVENYLLSIGVTSEEIENIRNIFLEDVK